MSISITKKTSTVNTTASSGRSIKYIVIHYTAGTKSTAGQAANTAAYFAKTSTKASADFIVDDSTIVQYNPDIKNRYTWHCGGSKVSGSSGGSYYGVCKNSNSIGVEICSTNSTGTVKNANDSTWSFTTTVLKKATELVQYLMETYSIDEDHVIRHYDVNGKYCLPLDKTELLTKDGWVPLDDISVGDVVAQYVPETDTIEFAPVSGKLEPYDTEVLLNRGVEATADHRMYLRSNCKKSTSFREIPWGEAVTGHKQFVIKNGAVYEGAGLNLTDDELRFLVWVQGDGHYMHDGNSYYGIEFHLSKQRKIVEVMDLLEALGYQCTVCERENETISFRLYGKHYVDWCEQWLTNKQFNYKWLEMTTAQFEIFWDELLKVDGCQTANIYTSAVEQNLDVVQAICATKGARTNKSKLGSKRYEFAALLRSNSNYTVGNEDNTTSRVTAVSCVTVPSGYILIRQGKKTFVVGNCPGITGWNANSGSEAKWKSWKSGLTESSTSSSSTSTTTSSSTTTASTSTGSSSTTYTIKTGVSGTAYTLSTIQSGSTGETVKFAQQLLNAYGSYGLSEDGIFGTKTTAAVKKYQKAQSLTQDGIIGKNTWTKLLAPY